MTELELATIRLHKISSIIFLVSSRANFKPNYVLCPHGNCPSYPTHAWWCDGCFQELEDALEEVAGLFVTEE